jgi:hypothetical protein
MTKAIAAAPFDLPFPDGGPERLVRRGILSCAASTGADCAFVLLLPGDTTR